MEGEKVEDLLLSLPRALKVLRESRHLDQDGLARLMAGRYESVGRASIARYEAGKRSPSLEALRGLMGALDVTWEELGRALAGARKGDSQSFDSTSEKPEISSKLLKPKSAAKSRPKKSDKRPRKRERRPERPDSEDEQNGK